MSGCTQTNGEVSMPPPNGVHAGQTRTVQETSPMPFTKESKIHAKGNIRSREDQLATNKIQSQRQSSNIRTAYSPTPEQSASSVEPSPKSKETVGVRPNPLKRKLGEIGDTLSKHGTSVPRGEKVSAESLRRERMADEVPSAIRIQSVAKPTLARRGRDVREASTNPAPLQKTDKNNIRRQDFANRREATLAFMKHVQVFAQEFIISPPRSERQFIWSFLESIPDTAWAEFMQKKLLEEYPTAVRPSIGVRAKHSINFDSGLTWRHILETIRKLQQKPVTSEERVAARGV